MLTEHHERQWVDAAQEFLDCHKTDGEEFLDSIVTGDVTLVHYTTPEIKDQSTQGRKGLLLCDFMRRGTTINSDRYCKTLKQIRRAIQNKRRGMLTKRVRFHHDNARPHTAHQTTALIEEFEWELVSHPPYSPDVAPSDFYFFPELKKNLGGTQFQDDDELEEAVLGFYAARRQSSLTLGSINSPQEGSIDRAPILQAAQNPTASRSDIHHRRKGSIDGVPILQAAQHPTTTYIEEGTKVNDDVRFVFDSRGISTRAVLEKFKSWKMAISEPKSARLREVLLFAFNWKKSASEAHRMLEEVYGDHALSKSQCYRWFKKFQSGDFELDNEPRGKPPQKFEDAELKALLDEDSTQTQEKLAKQLQVSQCAVSLRLYSLGMTQKLSKWVPHELSERQQQRRLDADVMLILQHDNAPAHNATVVKNTIKDLGWELLPHPPYSPDLAPSDYHLFTSLGHALKNQEFSNSDILRKWLVDCFDSKEI
ncbi:hypothetical protein LAZ67_23002073 [Cordylochernes scorpioides]|uniref:Mos1 transposase HTH domain-containing protein n=1 Tax=Cordylochernes scorpioides TaxID=51811 RepID=A0ABY6LU61_9ARAC|nr:hypothetical protein LAZ67_23002073 [Cordylochernes scorpioides]